MNKLHELIWTALLLAVGIPAFQVMLRSYEATPEVECDDCGFRTRSLDPHFCNTPRPAPSEPRQKINPVFVALALVVVFVSLLLIYSGSTGSTPGF